MRFLSSPVKKLALLGFRTPFLMFATSVGIAPHFPGFPQLAGDDRRHSVFGLGCWPFRSWLDDGLWRLCRRRLDAAVGLSYRIWRAALFSWAYRWLC